MNFWNASFLAFFAAGNVRECFKLLFWLLVVRLLLYAATLLTAKTNRHLLTNKNPDPSSGALYFIHYTDTSSLN